MVAKRGRGKQTVFNDTGSRIESRMQQGEKMRMEPTNETSLDKGYCLSRRSLWQGA